MSSYTSKKSTQRFSKTNCKLVLSRLSLAFMLGGALFPTLANASGQPPNPVATTSSELAAPVSTNIVNEKDHVQVVLSQLDYDLTTQRAGLTFNLTTTRETPIEEVTIKVHFFNKAGREVASKEMPILRGEKDYVSSLLTDNNPQEKQIWIHGLSDSSLNEDQVKFEITQVEESF